MKIQALQVGSIGTNCYILCDEAAKVCAVIDPGAEPELILSAAEKLDCTVDKILLTHGHYDHTGAVAALMETLPPTAVYIHQADFDSPQTQLFPLKSELARIPFGGVREFLRRGRPHHGGHAGASGASHPRPLRGQRHAAVRRYPVLRGHPVCRFLRQDGFSRWQHEADDGLSGPAGRPSRGLPGPAGTHGAQHSGPGAALQPYMQMALREQG